MKFKVENGVLKKCINEKAYEEELCLPDGIVRIASGSMIGITCETEKLVFPEGLQRIEDFAIDNFLIAKEVVFPDSLIYIGKDDLNIYRVKELFVPNPKAEISPEALDSMQQWVKVITIPALPIESIPNTEGKYGSTSVLKEAAAWGYLHNKELFTNSEIIKGYEQYLLRQRKKILKRIFKEDYPEGLVFYADKKKITKANIVEDYIDPANAASAEKCKKWLANYKEAHFQNSVDKEKKLDKAKAQSVAELKKMWTFRKDEDNNIVITNYKGKEAELAVPDYIGKARVVAIDPDTFSVVKSGRTFSSKSGIKSIKKIFIPDTVTKIGRNAFFQCHELKELRLPDHVEIEEPCFGSCDGLTDENGNIIINGILYWHKDGASDVVVPDDVHKIGINAFDCCNALKSVEIPDSVTDIGRSSFENCYQLSEITLPKRVNIEEPCFLGCEGLTDNNGNIIFNDVLYWNNGQKEEVIIPENVKRIAKYAFRYAQCMKAVRIPGTVQIIGDHAFNGCDVLSDITIDKGVKEIGAYAFSFMDSIKSIEIPDTVDVIGDSAFECCSKLKQINIGNKAAKLGRDLFIGTLI